MPKLDLNPHAISSSSSERNASRSNRSSSNSSSMCWCAGGNSKIQKSSLKHPDPTEEAKAGPLQMPPCRSQHCLMKVKIPKWSSCFKADSRNPNVAMSDPGKPRTKITGRKTIDSSVIQNNCLTEGLIERVSSVSSVRDRLTMDKSLVTSLLAAKKVKPEETPGFIWSDKYRPKALRDFICHTEKAEILQNLGGTHKSSHYIVEGPPGVGKRTMALAMLGETFGLDELEAREEVKEIKLEGGPVPLVQIRVNESLRHIEIDLSQVTWYAGQVLTELVKGKHTMTLNQEIKECEHEKCRGIIVHEADRLPVDAQLNIRSLFERSEGCFKFFFCCSNISKLKHLRSLCTVIQLLPPLNKEIVEVLQFISKQEAIQLPHYLAENIAEKSNHNLQQAIRSFEATWQFNYPFKEDQEIMTGWEKELSKIAKDITKDQSPKQLYKVKQKLKILMQHSVSPAFIFSMLVTELKLHLNDEFQSILAALVQNYNINDEHFCIGENLSTFAGTGTNDQIKKNAIMFMRIEEFTAKFMTIFCMASKQFKEKRRVACVMSLNP